jgi:hypothetical protein
VVCNWLSIGGLIFTGILVLWNCNGALIIGARLQDHERNRLLETLA